MGELPKNRIESNGPFYTTGLDFCGPFAVKYKNQRKDTDHKVYVCIFVCFTTKACHLEIVEDATAESFIACIKRFFNRRGKSKQLWSDNGTNFVGAHNKINSLERMFKENYSKITSYCATEGVVWNFIPPRAPHFGGLWESGVKIVKAHMKRVIGAKSMTLEYLYTLIIQIEGIMNSRPITELSSDPNDYEPLTPGHFLIGRPINSILEPDVSEIPTNRLSQWQQITKSVQHIWKRFYAEYINMLQQRNKWKVTKENLKANEMVVIVEDNIPPLHWLLGRVDEIIKGPDGNVRCAIIRTKNGKMKRSITKISRLPLYDHNE